MVPRLSNHWAITGAPAILNPVGLIGRESPIRHIRLNNLGIRAKPEGITDLIMIKGGYSPSGLVCALTNL